MLRFGWGRYQYFFGEQLYIAFEVQSLRVRLLPNVVDYASGGNPLSSADSIEIGAGFAHLQNSPYLLFSEAGLLTIKQSPLILSQRLSTFS